MSLVNTTPSHLPRERQRAYTYGNNKSRFVVALYAHLFHSRIDCVVLQEVATGRFVVIPRDEFRREWSAV